MKRQSILLSLTEGPDSIPASYRKEVEVIDTNLTIASLVLVG